MIEKIKEYISNCPYLKEFVEINVNYLTDKVTAYSVNESVGYNPIVSKDIIGNKECQFLFNFDAKLHWNDEVVNNINNSKFFENFRDWLEENDNNGIYPDVENIRPLSIEATTNGFLFLADSDEAIYRISCRFTYLKIK